ncbi:uncharacterized protein LOC122637188 [Vespula pensylvanica]|uniref:uncharacterized protein LOC122637188 n=1 Tax=Vespula pensylvanica TaxID=30213 RepID=UPI001CBA2CE5|nr:uncharacterized protein LOC122637188 [Vespula pensylvanica]
MATFFTTNSNLWDFESVDLRLGRFESRPFNGGQATSSNKFKGEISVIEKSKNNNQSNRQVDKKILSTRKKGMNYFLNKPSSPMISMKGFKNISNNKDNSCRVKTSALLYEITDRINQLAQPRIRSNVYDLTENRASVNKIPKATPRILELSKPKTIYKPPSKLFHYVAPAALSAIPTDRIIELSRPKKNQKKTFMRKKKLIYAPCNSRILYLARAKSSKFDIDDFGRTSSRHRKFRMEKEKSKKKQGLRKCTKELIYNTNRLNKNVRWERMRKKRKRKEKRCRRGLARQDPRSSNSNRTVISINQDYDPTVIIPRKSKSKKRKQKDKMKANKKGNFLNVGLKRNVGFF